MLSEMLVSAMGKLSPWLRVEEGAREVVADLAQVEEALALQLCRCRPVHRANMLNCQLHAVATSVRRLYLGTNAIKESGSSGTHSSTAFGKK